MCWTFVIGSARAERLIVNTISIYRTRGARGLYVFHIGRLLRTDQADPDRRERDCNPAGHRAICGPTCL